MKITPVFLAWLLALGSLCGAPATRNPVLRVEWTFQEDMSVRLPKYAKSLETRLPRRLDFRLPYGEPLAISKMKAIPFPSEFEPPQRLEKEGIVTPSTPSQFEPQDLGYKLEVQAAPAKGGVRLLGRLVIRAASVEQGVFGEETGPIYASVKNAGIPKRVLLTGNFANTARLKTVESFFQLNALPGKTYAMTLSGPDGPVKVKVRCTIAN